MIKWISVSHHIIKIIFILICLIAMQSFFCQWLAIRCWKYQDPLACVFPLLKPCSFINHLKLVFFFTFSTRLCISFLQHCGFYIATSWLTVYLCLIFRPLSIWKAELTVRWGEAEKNRLQQWGLEQIRAWVSSWPLIWLVVSKPLVICGFPRYSSRQLHWKLSTWDFNWHMGCLSGRQWVNLLNHNTTLIYFIDHFKDIALDFIFFLFLVLNVTDFH